MVASGAFSEAVVSALSSAGAYPHDASARRGVELEQTHISFVFLTGERVYKFRKPVELPFLDFSSVELRNADCVREVTLNRRLAPDVYLGVAPLLVDGDRFEIGAVVEAPAREHDSLEHCVVMRRLPSGRDALSLLESGALSEDMIVAVARHVSRFHQAHSLGVPAPFEPAEWSQRVSAPVEANYESLRASADGVVPSDLLERAHRDAGDWMRTNGTLIEQRRLDGRAVDGHGDLHLEHVWFEADDAGPLIVDCVEFNERLRRIDAASDAAFLAMDLSYRGRRDLAELFLRAYSEASGDYGLYGVVDYFISYRALVRAKVAALAANDAAIDPRQREEAGASALRHLRLGAEVLGDKGVGWMIATCGTVGTGKTTVARSLAARLDAALISSDRLRKSMAGLAPQQSLSSRRGHDAYSMRSRDLVYEELLRLARLVASTGRNVIVDATFSRRRWRDLLTRSATMVGAGCALVNCRADPAVVEKRLLERARWGSDASDAGVDVMAKSAGEFEEPEEWPSSSSFEISTETPGWDAELEPLVRLVGGQPRN